MELASGMQLEGGQEKDREDPGTGLLVIDEVAIETVKRNVALMERAVSEVLIEGIDYGTVPGISLPFLWDSGASKVRDMYNVYPEHKVISLETDAQGLMTIIMSVALISRKTGKAVAVGIGAATMMESKYRYKWEFYPENWGYKKEDLKKKKVDGKWKYRILNPDVSELVNTITKICAKRGEVDGSQTLPGVASAMAKIKQKKRLGGTIAPPVDTATGEILDEPDWNQFWGQTKQMGLIPDQVHSIVGCKSMVDWVKAGNKLPDAIAMCRNVILKEQHKGHLPGHDGVIREGSPADEELFGGGDDSDKPEEGEFTEEDRVIVDAEANEPIYEEMSELRTIKKPRRDASTITTKNQFCKACHEDFRLQPTEAIKCTGTTADQITKWSDAYLQVAAVYSE